MNDSNIEVISVNHFKSVLFSVHFRMPLEIKKLTVMQLLSQILLESTKKYPTQELFSNHLANLYGLYLDAGAMRRDNGLVLGLYAFGVDEQYLEKPMYEVYLRTLKEVIYEPNITKEIFEYKKEVLKQKIKEELLEKSYYGVYLALSSIDEKNPFSVPYMGSIEELSKLTYEDFLNEYQELVSGTEMTISAIGNLDDSIKEKIRTVFPQINDRNQRKWESTYYDKKPEVLQSKKTENMDQTKLYMCYQIDHPTLKEKYYLRPLFINILEISKENNLGRVVRDQHNMCYYIHTTPISNLLIIESGISKENSEKVVQMVENVMNGLKKSITSADLELAREKELKHLRAEYDNLYLASKWSYLRNINGITNRSEEETELNNITVAEVEEFSQRLQLVKVFILEGRE